MKKENMFLEIKNSDATIRDKENNIIMLDVFQFEIEKENLIDICKRFLIFNTFEELHEILELDTLETVIKSETWELMQKIYNIAEQENKLIFI